MCSLFIYLFSLVRAGKHNGGIPPEELRSSAMVELHATEGLTAQIVQLPCHGRFQDIN